MIVNYLDILWFCVGPEEADPPLPVYPDAVLSGPVTCQLLQPVAWRDEEVCQRLRGIEDGKLAPGGALRWPVQPPGPLAPPAGQERNFDRSR